MTSSLTASPPSWDTSQVSRRRSATSFVWLLFKSTVVYLFFIFVPFRRTSQEVLPPVRPAARRPG